MLSSNNDHDNPISSKIKNYEELKKNHEEIKLKQEVTKTDTATQILKFCEFYKTDYQNRFVTGKEK